MTYVEVQEHDPDHESRGTEQAHAQSSYSERKMEGAIHIPSRQRTMTKHEWT